MDSGSGFEGVHYARLDATLVRPPTTALVDVNVEHHGLTPPFRRFRFLFCSVFIPFHFCVVRIPMCTVLHRRGRSRSGSGDKPVVAKAPQLSVGKEKAPICVRTVGLGLYDRRGHVDGTP